ncbi:GTPase family protein [Pseudoroseicyclus aestuarii]|uniref:G domain-containing protein n=1 Tax=Pseudoroseicyclus aestuarii TaxID=1795041 RepID=A0A318SPN6_9RHOB|nr:GTPase [Pseudoroseicyclus aestuarii]PYE83841.1 hypothetical protein DFP88_103202 [Pseudoroseicyclus aestuarii]
MSRGTRSGRVARLRRALLRWDRVISAVVLALPVTALSLLGFLWLEEHGALLPFIAICAGAGLVGWLLRRFLLRPAPGEAQPSALMEEMAVDASKSWQPHEARAFEAARAKIEAATQEPMEWEEMPDLARKVIDGIAEDLGKKRRALDFSLPEALLLTERAASRYRRHLRRHVPFSDRVSLATLWWLWKHRDRAQLAVEGTMAGWRVLRMLLNPARGVLREVEYLIAEGNSNYLGSQAMGVLQAVLLEEVAYASVELYSGRLRFSDAELLELHSASARTDRARLALPDAPLRVLVVGQTSAGKSTLVNALLGEDRAETDMRATTEGAAGYEADLDGTPVHVLDTGGNDGSAARRAALIQELTQCDVVLWVMRANRPSRAVDAALWQDFTAFFEARPDRRRPPVVAALSCADLLATGWPFPEHALPETAKASIAEATRAVAGDLPGLHPIPVSAIEPDWNVGAVRRALENAASEGLLTQRNRLRIEGGREVATSSDELARGTRALGWGARLVGSRLASRMLGERARGARAAPEDEAADNPKDA